MVEETPSRDTAAADPAMSASATGRGAVPQSASEDDDGPFPGWYPDPLGRGAERFWNGREWTANHRGDPTASSPASSEASTQPSKETEPSQETLPSRPRIFGNTTNTAEAETTVDPVAAETPPASSTPQGERVKSALNEWAGAGSSGATALIDAEPFTGSADTRSVTAQATSVLSSPRSEPVPSSSKPATEPDTTKGKEPIEAAAQPVAQASSPSAPAKPTVVTPRPNAATAPTERAPTTTAPASVEPPASASVPPGSGARRWLALVLATLCALALGLAVGWMARGSGGTTTASPVTTSADDAVGSGSDEGAGADGGSSQDSETDGNSGSDEGLSSDEMADADGQALGELQDQLDAVASELDNAQLELEALTIERDNEQAHNDILQTWFTPEVRDRSERNWNAEVERACASDAAPTLENTSYTRAMELMGTHADLVAAVAQCQAGG